VPSGRMGLFLILKHLDRIVPGAPELEVLKWIDERYKNIDYKEFEGVNVYLFEKNQ